MLFTFVFNLFLYIALDVSVTKGGDVWLSCFFWNNNSITWTENNQKIVDKGSRQSDIDKQFRLHVQRIRNSTIFKCKQNTTLSNLRSPNSGNLSSFQISARSFKIKIIGLHLTLFFIHNFDKADQAIKIYL